MGGLAEARQAQASSRKGRFGRSGRAQLGSVRPAIRFSPSGHPLRSRQQGFPASRFMTHSALPVAAPQGADLDGASPLAEADSTRTPLYGERAIADARLICFDNPRPGRPYEVSIELPEFTCRCPFSGYPDFAVLRLLYQPGPRVLELKAIKLYVNSYRERSISHEEVANRILDDCVAACDPVWMELVADFHPRGNVHTVVRVSHGQRHPC
jgi:7-cyano-7-deazaguanine reductase